MLTPSEQVVSNFRCFLVMRSRPGQQRINSDLAIEWCHPCDWQAHLPCGKSRHLAAVCSACSRGAVLARSQLSQRPFAKAGSNPAKRRCTTLDDPLNDVRDPFGRRVACYNVPSLSTVLVALQSTLSALNELKVHAS